MGRLLPLRVAAARGLRHRASDDFPDMFSVIKLLFWAAAWCEKCQKFLTELGSQALYG
jgi:hypothetical protein